MWKLEVAVESGLGVPWSAVLRYEYHIRRQATEFVKDLGITLKAALIKAMDDSELRALHLTAYITLQGRKRGRDDENNQYTKDPPPNNIGKGEGDKTDHNPKVKGGKGKGKGGKVGTKGGLPAVSQTPDRRITCFVFNGPKACDGSCGTLHVCRVKDCLATDHCLLGHEGYDAAAGYKREK